MSTQASHDSHSATEAICPDCGATLSRRSDLKRHRKSQHPNGTELKFRCPYVGCEFKTDQKSNLVIHMNGPRHSNEHRYPCQDCGKGYTDPAARIRHRKAVHGYQPYHTPQYYARRARGKATLKKGDQKPANVLPPQPATQSASSSSSSSSSSSAESPGHFLANVTYHDEVWKLLLNVPHRDGPGENTSQDAQISTPVAAAPARDTPSPLRSDSDLSLPPPPPPNVGQQQQQPTATQTGDGARYQWEQSQALAQSWAAYPGSTSFPTSSWQSATYPAGTSFQSLPPFSFTNAAVPSSSSFDSPATSTSTASSSASYMISPDYIQTPTPLDALNWNPAISAPMSQTEFFTGEPNRGFKTEDFA